MPISSSVVFNDVSFTWNDGSPVLEHVTATFSRRSTGLIGANGVGKSTLLRLIAGDLAPASGSIATAGTVEYLEQDAEQQAGSVAGLLGIAPVLHAIRAVESGSAEPELFDTIGDSWDVGARAAAELAAFGLPNELDRPAATLSGGEAMLTAIVGVRLRGADIALLDEPTNNLDVDARARLYELIGSWRGTLIAVSHDVDLLDMLDTTADLRAGGLTMFGGPYSEYRQWVTAQQEAAQQALRTAEQALKRQQQERVKAEERIAHSQRQGRKDRENRKFIPMVLNNRRDSAEKTHGARRTAVDARIGAAKAAVTAADETVRSRETIRVDLPDPDLPQGRTVLDLVGADGRGHVIEGPERVGLIGVNGVGKTTLLRALLPTSKVRAAYLPQRIELDPDQTVLESIRVAAPGLPLPLLRNRLARLLIRRPMLDRSTSELSGGERFRVALARLILADPTPQLLVLDEPTNSLDIDSVGQLIEALDGWRGALIVVSHDRAFLRRLGLRVTLRLGQSGNLAPVPPRRGHCGHATVATASSTARCMVGNT